MLILSWMLGASQPLAAGEELVRQPDDAVEVLIGLRGKADHEVEFERAPTAREDGLRRIHEVQVAHGLVDDPPEPLGPRLRGKGESGLPRPGNCLDHGGRKRSDAERGERDRDAAFPVRPHEVADKRLDVRVVAGAERSKGKLFVPGAGKRVPQEVLDRLRASLAVGPVDDACLAEAAAADAAARHLDRDAVVDRLHERQERPVGIGRRFDVFQKPPADNRVSPGRDEEPVALRDRFEERLPARMLLFQFDDLVHRLFRFSDEEDVNEVRERPGIDGARSAGDDDGMAVVPVRRPAGDAGKIKGRQDIGVRKFVLERNSDDVEFVDREVRFETGERPPRCPELFLIVRPGREHAFANGVLALVQDMIEDADAKVRHADLVGVGEKKADLRPYGPGVLVHCVDLGVDVPGRLADERKEIFVHGNSLRLRESHSDRRQEYRTLMPYCAMRLFASFSRTA